MSLADLERFEDKLQPRVYRRCRHIVTENERTLLAAKALRSNDVQRFGELMYGSHGSLRDHFEVSCSELDILVDLAEQCDGVYGARMTGGGFGGCTVNLVADGSVDQFRVHVTEGYKKATGKVPAIYVCSAADGAEKLA